VRLQTTIALTDLMENDMGNKPKPRDWVHIIGGFIIVTTLVLGTISFMKHNAQEMSSLFSFIPTAIATVLLVIIRIIVDGDVATSMCFLLLSAGFACLFIGLYHTNETTKNAWVGAAGALLGLGGGVPFGDFLRNVQEKRSN
jgi:hypothetical protein